MKSIIKITTTKENNQKDSKCIVFESVLSKNVKIKINKKTKTEIKKKV